jgi:2'-5' RNA ligase
MDNIDLIKQKISKLVGSPLPQEIEESRQGRITLINTPHKATKEEYTRRNPENIQIDPDSMIAKLLNEPVHEGSMVAIYPTKEFAEEIALKGGEPASKLHITLFYFDQEELTKVNTHVKIINLLEKFSNTVSKFKITLSKTSTFPQEENLTPYIVLVDSKELIIFRENLAKELDNLGILYSKKFEYTPHITLKYLEDDEIPDKEINKSFIAESVSYVLKDEDLESFELKKSMDTTGDSYAEGLDARQQYVDLNTGKHKIDDKEEPIVSKAAFSPDAPNKEVEIDGEQQQDKIEKMLIPVLSVIHYKNGRVQTSVRWRNPESLGVKKIDSKSPLLGVITVEEAPYFTVNSRVKQTLYYLAEQIEIDRLYENEYLPVSDDEKYGQGLYLYSDLDKAKEINKDQGKTILPVKVLVNKSFVLEDQVDFKNKLTNLGYDSIYIPTNETRIFNLFVFDSKNVRVIGQEGTQESKSISKSEDDFAVDTDTLKKLQCTPSEEEFDDESISKAVIQTPQGKDGSVDYDKVPINQSIWVTVTRAGPLAGRHILITKRPDGLFAITGGAAYAQIKDKYGTETTPASLRHLVMGGNPQKNVEEEKIDEAVEEREKFNEPLMEKKKELMAEEKKRLSESFEEFKNSVGMSETLSSAKLKTQREDLVKHAHKAGLSEDEAYSYASSIIRHVAAANRQQTEQRSREIGVKELKLFESLREMKDKNPAKTAEEIAKFNSETEDFRSGIKIELPSPEQFKGLSKEEIDGKTGDFINEKITEAINPDTSEKTLDEELKTEGLIPEGIPVETPTIEILPESKKIDIKNIDSLKNSVDKFKNFHQVQNEINAVKHLLKPKTFAQVTPELLEQMTLSVKAIIPEATDLDIQEIEQSYQDQYQQNNSALAFYSALGDFWNDKTALTQKENRIDNGLGEYINSGATGALAALTGKYFGKRFEAATLIEKTSIETAALVAAHQLRDELKNEVSKYNEIINKVAKFNNDNQIKTEKEALTQHKELKDKYATIQSEKAKGTLTSEAFLLDAQVSNLLEQKNNLGTALGSLQASAAFLEALIVARDAKDSNVSIDFGKDRNGALMRQNELGLGSKSKIDDSNPNHNRLVTNASALKRFAKGQEVIKENYDKNEKLKSDMSGTFTDDEGKVFVKEYKVPFWNDEIDDNGKKIQHFFRAEQRNDIEFLKNQGGGLITRPTGTGKTNVALGFFANKIAEDSNYSALAVVPKGRVSQWVEEAHRFTKLPIVEIPEGLNKEKRAEIIAQIKPGQVAVISHRDAVYSYNTLDAGMKSKQGLFKGMVIDEPQELASKSVKGNMSASVRKLTHLPVDNRIALTATPARDHLIEAYDLVNWASHHDSALGPRSRFQKIYGGYGSGTNAQDSTLAQMIYKEISPFMSGDRLTNPNFKVKHDEVKIKKTSVQDDNMRDLEDNADKYIASERANFIKDIESKPEELKKWETRFGRMWKTEAGKKAGNIAKNIVTKNHLDNLEGIFGDKMKWADNPKTTEGVKFITANNDKKHVIFIDNSSQRKAIAEGLEENGFKSNQIENIASTITSGGVSGSKMSERVKNFRKNKDSRVIFIDKQSASGYNLQEGDVLHVMGTPSDAANYLQAQGRLARMPRVGDVTIRTYKYSDAPFEDMKWTKLDRQLKILKAVAPALFV